MLVKSLFRESAGILFGPDGVKPPTLSLRSLQTKDPHGSLGIKQVDEFCCVDKHVQRCCCVAGPRELSIEKSSTCTLNDDQVDSTAISGKP